MTKGISKFQKFMLILMVILSSTVPIVNIKTMNIGELRDRIAINAEIPSRKRARGRMIGEGWLIMPGGRKKKFIKKLNYKGYGYLLLK